MDDKKIKDLYTEIYGEIFKKTNELLKTYRRDEDESYQAGMVLLMLSIKMLMFSGFTKNELPELHENIEETFDTVYEDFKRVDLNLKN
jgi:hypothetical protein